MHLVQMGNFLSLFTQSQLEAGAPGRGGCVRAVTKDE